MNIHQCARQTSKFLFLVIICHQSWDTTVIRLLLHLLLLLLLTFLYRFSRHPNHFTVEGGPQIYIFFQLATVIDKVKMMKICTSFPEMNTLCVCVCALHAEVRISLGNSLIHSLVNHALQTNLVLSPDCAQTPLVIQACGLLIRGQRSFHSGLTTNHLVGDPTVSLLWNGVKCGSAKPTTGNPRGFALLEDNVFGTLWSTWSIRSPFIAALRHLAVARAIEIQSKCSSVAAKFLWRLFFAVSQ